MLKPPLPHLFGPEVFVNIIQLHKDASPLRTLLNVGHLAVLQLLG